MSTQRWLVCFLSLVLVPHSLFAGNALVLEGVNVIPMDREIVLEGMTVVVDQGRIVALDKDDRASVPASAQRIDARGWYLLPGLIEMHVHLRRPADLARYLEQGFTTVRDMNGRLGDTLTWRREIEEGKRVGPRIVAAGVTLYRDAPDDYPYPVKTPEQARFAVRDMKAKGYDLIKVYRLEREPFRALMEEARRLDIPVAGHNPDVVHDQSYDAPLDISMEEVIGSGMASLEHLDELINAGLRMKLDEDRIEPLAELLRSRGVAVTTILGQDIMVQKIHREGQAYLTEEVRRDIRAKFGEEQVKATEQQVDFIVNQLPRNIEDLGAAIPDFSLLMLRKFQKAGVDLLIGTDSNSPLVPAGRSALDEMDLFIRAGLKPYDALRAATTVAAKVLKRSDLGSIATGKAADLLLVEGNPLRDLATLRRPMAVISRGIYYDRTKLQALIDPD